jgi:hypothetical protein
MVLYGRGSRLGDQERGRVHGDAVGVDLLKFWLPGKYLGPIAVNSVLPAIEGIPDCYGVAFVSGSRDVHSFGRSLRSGCRCRAVEDIRVGKGATRGRIACRARTHTASWLCAQVYQAVPRDGPVGYRPGCRRCFRFSGGIGDGVVSSSDDCLRSNRRGRGQLGRCDRKQLGRRGRR